MSRARRTAIVAFAAAGVTLLGLAACGGGSAQPWPGDEAG